LLDAFRTSDSNTVLKTEILEADGESSWVSLHKTVTLEGDIIILVEDITAYERM